VRNRVGLTDNIERQMRYGGATMDDVLARIKAGVEDEKLKPGQRRRKKGKRGGTRRAMTRRPVETVALPGDEPPPARRVFEVYGQRWEVP